MSGRCPPRRRSYAPEAWAVHVDTIAMVERAHPTLAWLGDGWLRVTVIGYRRPDVRVSGRARRQYQPPAHWLCGKGQLPNPWCGVTDLPGTRWRGVRA